jgi:hypothetical protein
MKRREGEDKGEEDEGGREKDRERGADGVTRTCCRYLVSSGV